MLGLNHAPKNMPVKQRFFVNYNHRRAEQTCLKCRSTTGNGGCIRSRKCFARLVVNHSQRLHELCAMLMRKNDLFCLDWVAVGSYNDDELNVGPFLRNFICSVQHWRQDAYELFVPAAWQQRDDRA